MLKAGAGTDGDQELDDKPLKKGKGRGRGKGKGKGKGRKKESAETGQGEPTTSTKRVAENTSQIPEPKKPRVQQAAASVVRKGTVVEQSGESMEPRPKRAKTAPKAKAKAKNCSAGTADAGKPSSDGTLYPPPQMEARCLHMWPLFLNSCMWSLKPWCMHIYI